MAALRLTTWRVVGTVLAAGLADGVLHVVHDPVVVAGLAVGGEFLAVTVKDVNYTCFVFFLTLPLLLLSLPPQGQAHAVLRVATTLVSAVVALGISALSAWLAQRAAAPPRRPPEPLPGSAAV
jgi:Fusaric acid resistance protein-like